MKLDVYGCNISYYTGKLEAYLLSLHPLSIAADRRQ